MCIPGLAKNFKASPAQLDWQHCWAPVQVGEAVKAGWSTLPYPRSPIHLKQQLLPEQWMTCTKRETRPNTFPSSTACPVCWSWFTAAGCSTTGSSEPAASAIPPQNSETEINPLSRALLRKIQAGRRGIYMTRASNIMQILHRVRQHLLQLLLGADVRGVPTSLQGKWHEDLQLHFNSHIQMDNLR